MTFRRTEENDDDTWPRWATVHLGHRVLVHVTRDNGDGTCRVHVAGASQESKLIGLDLHKSTRYLEDLHASVRAKYTVSSIVEFTLNGHLTHGMVIGVPIEHSPFYVIALQKAVGNEMFPTYKVGELIELVEAVLRLRRS